jgi:hypothetical protein
MGDFLKDNLVMVIGSIVAGLLLLSGSFYASTAGVGIDHPPPEKTLEKRASVHHGGHFFIFYTGGATRGVGGRSSVGGGFRGGK